MKKIAYFLFVFSMLVACNGGAKDNAQSPKDKLLVRIENGIKSGTVMFGHQDATAYGHTWKYEPNRSDILEMVGDYPAIIGWDLGHIELGDSVNLDGVPFDFMRSAIQEHHRRGGINTISWHLDNPQTGGNSWDVSQKGVVKTVLEGGENHEKMTLWINRVADFLASLKDDNGELIPIIFRPWHEHTGSWFWWGEDLTSDEDYVALWDMNYKIFEQRKLNNLVWAYSPSTTSPYPTEIYAKKLPNVDQVDLFGIDIYQYLGKEGGDEFVETTSSMLKTMAELGEKYNKPIALTECGVDSVILDEWWTEVLLKSMEGAKVSYALVWRNAWDRPEHFYCAYKGHSSEPDFIKFYNSDRTSFLKEIQSF